MSGRIITETPAGFLEILSDGDSLAAVRKYSGPNGMISQDDITRETEKQLQEYFSGTRREFDLPIALQGTDFRLAVWNVLMKIPYGETRSYSDIAAAAGKPSAVRAVGNAVGDNPILIIVPCHRVVRSDGSMGGFSAGISMKEFLLRLEEN